MEEQKRESLGEFIHHHEEEAEHEAHTGEHIHILEDGTIIRHTHEHVPDHMTSDEEKTAVVNRLARAAGHLNSVRRMVEDDREVSEILNQLAAVRAEITNTAKVIMHNQIATGMVDAVEHGDMQAVKDLQEAIEKFIK